MQGKTVNGYTLQRLLGKGGMAEVWYAENNIKKAAAVKIILPGIDSEQINLTRFKHEAEMMEKLSHPNIRQIYDYGSVDSRPCIIMEYLEGDDLKTKINQGQRFSQQQVEKWWNQMASALNYTHARGIVHRDLKPSNIFIDQYDNVKLLDFGIAKEGDISSGTLTGKAMGTVKYMSPEQVKDPKRVDHRTDIYSLAVTFVHVLTGKSPYDSTKSNDFSIQLEITTKPLDLSGLPTVWREFLEPYLAKDPKQRPPLKEFTPDGNAGFSQRGNVIDDNDETFIDNQPSKESFSFVDLGLSVKWATCNLGADQPEKIGDYFAWGETVSKRVFSDETYQFSDRKGKNYLKYCTKPKFGKVDSIVTLDNSDDVVQTMLGGHWRMPSEKEMDELLKNCKSELVTCSGVKGHLLTSKINGNSIFLPYSSPKMGEGMANAFSIYWSSDLDTDNPDKARVFFFVNQNVGQGNFPRSAGVSIRPVYDEKMGSAAKPSSYKKNSIESQQEVFVLENDGLRIELVKVKGGTFWMGAHSKMIREGGLFSAKRPDNSIPNFNKYAQSHEGPVHQVILDDYYIAKYEFTQGQYFAVTGKAPSLKGGLDTMFGQGEDYPLFDISWNEIQLIIKRLNDVFYSQLKGMSLRLPTEAEWEYAARGGHKSMGYEYSGSNDLNDVAWFDENTNMDHFRPVGKKQSNELGLFDMNGNVYEYCSDWYGDYTSNTQTNPQGPDFGKEKVFRGGCVFNDKKISYLTMRGSFKPDKCELVGFRLAMS